MVQKLLEIICKIFLSSHQLYVTKKVTYYAGNFAFCTEYTCCSFFFLFAIMTLKYNKNKKKYRKTLKGKENK